MCSTPSISICAATTRVQHPAYESGRWHDESIHDSRSGRATIAGTGLWPRKVQQSVPVHSRVHQRLVEEDSGKVSGYLGQQMKVRFRLRYICCRVTQLTPKLCKVCTHMNSNAFTAKQSAHVCHYRVWRQSVPRRGSRLANLLRQWSK